MLLFSHLFFLFPLLFFVKNMYAHTDLTTGKDFHGDNLSSLFTVMFSPVHPGCTVS